MKLRATFARALTISERSGDAARRHCSNGLAFSFRERRREMVGQDAGTRQAFALVVGGLTLVIRLGRNLVTGGDALGLAPR